MDDGDRALTDASDRIRSSHESDCSCMEDGECGRSRGGSGDVRGRQSGAGSSLFSGEYRDRYSGAVISGLILDLFFLSVDYSGTETLQFEDDEYYYYVKAIPKVAGVPVQEKKVKHITEPHEEKKENLKPVMNTLEKKPEKVQEKPAAKAMSKPEADSHLQETIAMGTEEVVNELDRLYEVSEEDLARSVDEILLTKTLNEELEREQEEKKEDMGLTKSIVLGVEKLKENLRNKED